MRVLITGVNGFIGQHLADRLIKRNHQVAGIGRSKNSKIKNLSYFSGSVLDKTLLEKTMEDAEVIVHLAALTSHKDIVDNKSKTQEINLLGTKNVLETFSKSKTEKFIYASSGKVYGKIVYLPIDENHPTKPQNILGKSKLEVEELISYYGKNTKNKQLVIFRIFNVYGKGQNKNFLIPTIFKQLSEGKKEITLGDIKAKRDYLYIDDLVEAFVLAIENKLHHGISVYNICTGIASSAFEIVRLIDRIKNLKIKINVNPNLIRMDEPKDEYGTFGKAENELGWKPETNLEKGLRELCKQ